MTVTVLLDYFGDEAKTLLPVGNRIVDESGSDHTILCQAFRIRERKATPTEQEFFESLGIPLNHCHRYA